MVFVSLCFDYLRLWKDMHCDWSYSPNFLGVVIGFLSLTECLLKFLISYPLHVSSTRCILKCINKYFSYCPVGATGNLSRGNKQIKAQTLKSRDHISFPADILWGSFVAHSFLNVWRTNPKGRLWGGYDHIEVLLF